MLSYCPLLLASSILPSKPPVCPDSSPSLSGLSCLPICSPLFRLRSDVPYFFSYMCVLCLVLTYCSFFNGLFSSSLFVMVFLRVLISVFLLFYCLLILPRPYVLSFPFFLLSYLAPSSSFRVLPFNLLSSLPALPSSLVSVSLCPCLPFLLSCCLPFPPRPHALQIFETQDSFSSYFDSLGCHVCYIIFLEAEITDSLA